MKKMLGTSDAWSTIHLSHRPGKPAYYVVNWRIYSFFFCMDWLQIYVDDCMGNSQGWLLKMVRRSPFFQLQRVWKAGHGFILNYCACGWQQQGRRKGWKSEEGGGGRVVIICPSSPCWDSFNQGVLQRSLVQLICQNLGGGWGHFPLSPR